MEEMGPEQTPLQKKHLPELSHYRS
jgi:hypothetical protein